MCALFASNSNVPDDLLAGANDNYFAKEVTILSGQGALARGTVLGRITDGGANDGKFVIVDSTGDDDGRRTAVAILCEEIDATASDVVTSAWFTGEFNENALTLGGTDTVDTHKTALEARGIHLKPAIER